MHCKTLRTAEDARDRLGKAPLADPRSASEKLRDLLPLMRVAQITRIAEITGLDVIGLPVAQAIRPGAVSETTSLGRGPEIAQAAIGAVMESLERHLSERIPDRRVFLGTADRLGLPTGWFDDVASGTFPEWRCREIPWIAAISVEDLSLRSVPIELVDTRYSDPPPPFAGVFARTTTGLACHFDLRSALLHGLYECIERDAVARAFAIHGFFEKNRIDHAAIDHPPTRDLLNLCDRFGLAVALWLVPSPTGIPVVWCQVVETGVFEPLVILPTEGYAASLDFGRAAQTALAEALVTRAGVISGGREDQFRRHYDVSWNSPVAEAARALIRDAVFPVMPPPWQASRDPEDELDGVLDKIKDSGLGPVLFVPVARDQSSGVECVRVVLPNATMQTFER